MFRFSTPLGVGLSLVGSLLLSGCLAADKSPSEPFALASLAIEKQYVEPDCQGEQCSTVTISALEFPQAPALSEALQTRLLTLGMSISEESAQPAESWDGYAERFFELAEEDNRTSLDGMTSEALLEASVYARHNDLLVVELNSYVYHAGQAHGLPLTEFMVIDEREQRMVEASDMLLDGQSAAFDDLLAQAHRRWISEMGFDEQFTVNWPLSQSRNIAPLEDQWEVTYNVYEIAPYAAGQPTLSIPRAALEGIAKPRYLGR
ncbi:RsiV family protein [Vreelandella sp.]|uniref:RsiV family protein n=1 Tax=Vreelandella sp. TaxID=3137778 RepID=UPI003BABE7C4